MFLVDPEGRIVALFGTPHEAGTIARDFRRIVAARLSRGAAMSGRSLGERAFVALQHLLPQHLLSRLVGWIAASRVGLVRTALIRLFLRRYRVDLAEAARSDPAAYASFNEFFTRRLKAGRPDSMPTRAPRCARRTAS